MCWCKTEVHVSLEDEKKKKAQQAGVKRKAVREETDHLKKLKLSIQNDIDVMLKSADEFAEKAEKLCDMT